MPPAVARSLIATALLGALVAGCSSSEDRVRTDAAPRTIERVAVPDVVGANPEEALDQLCGAGLSVGSVKVVARTPEAGRRPGGVLAAARIRATRPAAGATVARGSPIELDMAVPRDGAIAFRNRC